MFGVSSVYLVGGLCMGVLASVVCTCTLVSGV